MLHTIGLPVVQRVNGVESTVVPAVVKNTTVPYPGSHLSKPVCPIPCFVPLLSDLHFIFLCLFLYPVGNKHDLCGLVYLTQDRKEQLNCRIEVVVTI